MRARLLAAFAVAAPLFGITPYFSDGFGTWNGGNWQANGTISAGGNRLTSADPAGGTAMSLVAPAGAYYETFATLRVPQSGGRYTILARASVDARYGPVTVAGSFIGVEFSNVVINGGNGTATATVVKRVGGALTQLAQFPVGLWDGMGIRVLVRPGGPQGFEFSVTIDERHAYWGDGDAALTGGRPGLGVAGAPAGSGFSYVAFYDYESTAPPAVTAASIASSTFSTSVDLQWKGVYDGDAGSGAWRYNVYRDGEYLTSVAETTFTDSALTAATPYTYWIVAQDFHLNDSPAVGIVVTTPPAGSFDPRRMGVKPNGTYWGAGGENIDMQSGNLNYTIPLLKAVGRGQSSVTLALSYNSQNWRRDGAGAGATYWKVGGDIGYGFGWRLQAGSLTPYYSDWWTIHHWVYTDATGAQYRLEEESAGLFVSKEGIYVTFDAAAAKLRFNDGSFWYFGAMSHGAEDDAGTWYPTLMQDSNGNQVGLSYQNGIGTWWGNSSGRLTQIVDAKTMVGAAYAFSYVNVGPGLRPHLESITSVPGREAYTFDLEGATVASPFVGGPSEASMRLRSITNSRTSQSTQLGYNLSGEMISATLPYGGLLEWVYSEFQYASQKTYREVTTRHLRAKVGGPRWQYDVVYPAETGVQIHAYRRVIDNTAQAMKTWWMNTNAAQPAAGLVYKYQEQSSVTGSAVLLEKNFGWLLNGGNPYVASAATTRGAVTTRVEQTLDAYGNQTQQKIFNTDLLAANARVYNHCCAN